MALQKKRPVSEDFHPKKGKRFRSSREHGHSRIAGRRMQNFKGACEISSKSDAWSEADETQACSKSIATKIMRQPVSAYCNGCSGAFTIIVWIDVSTTYHAKAMGYGGYGDYVLATLDRSSDFENTIHIEPTRKGTVQERRQAAPDVL